MLKKYLKVLLLTLSLIAFNTSCEEKVITTDPPEEGGGELPKPPETDVIETYYDGKITLLANDESNVLDKIRTRASQNSDLDENPHFVLLDEASAAQLLADESKTAKLKQLHATGSAIGCIKPSENWMKLYSHLTGIKPEKQSDALRNMFDNALFYIIKADGNVYIQTRYDKPAKVTSTITTHNKNKDDNSTPSTCSEEYTVEHNTNDYHMGRIAEKLVQWLNANKKENAKSPYFISGDETMDKILDANTIYTMTDNVTFNHHPHHTSYDPVTIHPTIRFYIRAAYSEKDDMDLYDVQMEQEVNANDIFKYENVVSHKEALYKWKYTGLTYAGPIVNTLLSDTYHSTIPGADIIGPVPRNEAGTVTTTHVPGGYSMGGSVTAEFSPKPAGVSPGFAFNYSLPADLTTTSHLEMPVVFSHPENRRVIWEYDAAGAYYHGPWGSNSHYEDAFPQISVTNCITNQVFLCTIPNSREYFSELFYAMDIDLYIDYRAKWARGGPWEGEDQTGTESFHSVVFADIPDIMRYFKDYRPACYGNKPEKDEWNSLVEMLQKGNPNFNAFYNNRIGGVTEDKLKKNAEDIWNASIDQMICSFSGTPCEYEYIMGLQDVVSGEFLPYGIRITPDKWEKVAIPTTE